MFCYTKWRGWVVEFQASVCQVMGGGKCSVWGWDLYCSLHYTTRKSLWLPNPNVCEDRAASHSGSQTISLSERQPAVLYPVEASNLSSCLCCKTTVPVAKPALGWLAEMDQFSFLICLCDRRKQQEGEMETKRTQVCTGLYNKHGPFPPLLKVQTGQPDEDLWIRPRTAGTLFHGRQTPVHIPPLEPRTLMIWDTISYHLVFPVYQVTPKLSDLVTERDATDQPRYSAGKEVEGWASPGHWDNWLLTLILLQGGHVTSNESTASLTSSSSFFKWGLQAGWGVFEFLWFQEHSAILTTIYNSTTRAGGSTVNAILIPPQVQLMSINKNPEQHPNR